MTVLVLMMLAVVDFGRLVALQSAAFTASREAARYGSAVGGVTPRYLDCAGIRSAAQQVVGGLLTLTASDLRIWYDDGTGRTGYSAAHACGGASRDTAGEIDPFDRVVVEVNVTYAPVSPVRVLVPSISVTSVDRRAVVK